MSADFWLSQNDYDELRRRAAAGDFIVMQRQSEVEGMRARMEMGLGKAILRARDGLEGFSTITKQAGDFPEEIYLPLRRAPQLRETASRLITYEPATKRTYRITREVKLGHPVYEEVAT